MNRFPISTALLALAGAVPAQSQIQPVCVVGRVERLASPVICPQAVTHRIACTDTYLRSAAIDLNRYNDQIVELSGNLTTLGCKVIAVHQVAMPRATLTHCGTASTCCPVKLKVCPVGMGRWFLLGSARPGFAPVLVPMGLCTQIFFLGDPFLAGMGGPGACGEVILRIPCDNWLVGLRVWFQGARMDIGPVGPMTLTNPECLRIAPFMPPCGPLNC